MAVNLMKNIVIFALLCGIANSLMELAVFENVIQRRCYNTTHNQQYLLNGQRIPLSSSLETFIGLIESFETNYTNYSPEEVAEKFLRRFRINGLGRTLDAQRNEYTFIPNANEENRKVLLEHFLFGSNQRQSSFPEEAFTEEEKCALYYMMSHRIYNCTKEERLSTETPEKPCIIEQGVASLYNHEVHAVTPSRLLLGILAGLRNLKEVSVKEILDSLSFQYNNIDNEKRSYLNEMIDPIYAVTVGDVVVEEIRRVETDINSRKFGPNGKWNSTICPTKYYLISEDKPTDATYAQLRGAGDGLLLGIIAKKLVSTNQKLTISSLLRMYYSEHGIVLPGTGIKYNYCDRYGRWMALDDEITKQILNYARLMSIKTPVISTGRVTHEDQVRQAMSEFENSRRKIVDIVDQIRCGEYGPCEKVADVFVVMDTRDNEVEVENKQELITSELTTYLDIRLYGGSMTVLSLSRGSGDRQLENIIYNATSKGCVSCLVDWFRTQSKSEEEAYVFESINKTLMLFEKEKDMFPGVPGKVLIYFNYADSPPRKDRNLRSALWEVENKHRDVPIFAIGKSKELLEMFSSDDDKAMMSDENTVSTLREKICETYSTFQYPSCRERKSSSSDTAFQGYVTPGYIQYWAMYPEYFLKSFNIKFYFSATNGQITVCHSRESRKESLRNCKDTTGTDKERVVEYSISNPCKDKNVYNCKPFYFSIKGKEVDSNTANVCTEKECKTIDQIKFTVWHEGVSCNSSTSLISSLKIVIALLVIFCLIKKNI